MRQDIVAVLAAKMSGEGSTCSALTIVIMEGVREAVASGRIERPFVEAARSTARSVVGERPPPSGGPCWFDEDIDDLVQETILRITLEKLVLAAHEAANDTEFLGGWLRCALKSTLDIRARETPVGRVIRAVDDALGEDPEQFRLANGCWRLASDSREMEWQGSVSELVSVAWKIETATVRASRTASKTPPMAYRRDIRSVCSVLLGVSGPMTKRDLADVLAQRFNVVFEQRFEYPDFDEESHERPGTVPATEAVENELVARWMLEQITAEEQKILRLVLDGASIRTLADVLDCSKYRA